MDAKTFSPDPILNLPRRAIRRAGGRAAAYLLLSLATAGPAAAVARVDCFADRVAVFDPAFEDPVFGFGAGNMPGIVLGPPGDSSPTLGSLSVVSLGRGGVLTFEFTDNVIVDGPGPDLILFENSFFVGAPPAAETDEYRVGADLGRVQVSADGETYFEFPFSEEALLQAGGDSLPSSLLSDLSGLSGVTPTFTGNWTHPDDPDTWDPQGVGGVSGAGGDVFDLAAVGLSEARFVRIVDSGALTGFSGTAEGTDLDAVIALHSRPAAPLVSDTDGDGLDDLAELIYYGSRPDDPDTDGDGINDGEEVAGCTDPSGIVSGPFFFPESDLMAAGGGSTLLKWSFLGSAFRYDAARGNLLNLATAGASIDLGPLTCIEDNSADVKTLGSEDGAAPLPGEGFFYVVRGVRASGPETYGVSSGGFERIGSGGCQ